jgi:NADPH:quinone reductase
MHQRPELAEWQCGESIEFHERSPMQVGVDDSTMRAIYVADGELVDAEVPVPDVRGRDVLVRVQAVGINPVDVKVRAALRKSAEQRILGWDAAGVVERVGSEVSMFRPGEEVFFAGSILRQGCNSELCLVDERIMAHKPRNVSIEQAAAIPLTALTAYEALFEQLPLLTATREQTLLVIGGAGGVASLAIQLAKQLSPIRVVAAASRPQSKAWVKALGADYVIDHALPLAEQLQAIGASPVDFVLCARDTEQYFASVVELLRPRGAAVFIVEPKQPLDMHEAFRKSLRICWELMFTRSIFQADDMIYQHRILSLIARLVDAGKVCSPVTSTHSPISAATLSLAHRQLQTGRTIGKVVLTGGFSLV